jgi:hypothetical protein
MMPFKISGASVKQKSWNARSSVDSAWSRSTACQQSHEGMMAAALQGLSGRLEPGNSMS